MRNLIKTALGFRHDDPVQVIYSNYANSQGVDVAKASISGSNGCVFECKKEDFISAIEGEPFALTSRSVAGTNDKGEYKFTKFYLTPLEEGATVDTF